MDFGSTRIVGGCMTAVGITMEYIINQTFDFIKTPVVEQLGSIKPLDLVLILAIVGCATVVVIDILRQYKSLKESKIEVYKQTRLPTTVSRFFETSEHDLYLCGITLQSLTHIIPSIQKALGKNVTVRILICDPKSEYMEEIEDMVDSRGTSDRIDGTLKMLVEKIIDSDKVSNKAKKKLEIKTFDKLVPTHSLIIVDPEHSKREMQVEPYPYGIAQENRRVMKISNSKNHEELFNFYLESFNNIWSRADEYPKTPKPIPKAD
jgi:hypothetical protein